MGRSLSKSQIISLRQCPKRLWLETRRPELAQPDESGRLDCPNPCGQVKIAKRDNRRLRFLTPEEAKLLLTELKKRSAQVYGEAALSLFTGLRSGEIFSLRWSDLDFENKLIIVRDPKNRKNRHAFMTEELEALLQGFRQGQKPDALVFPGRDGQRQRVVSCTFRRAVQEVGLNAGIADSRQKAVFHSLRHTFASWLAQDGEPLYTIAQLLGHSSLAMTARYSHLAPDNLRRAAGPVYPGRWI